MRVFIIGPDGSGKSTAAWLLSNELMCSCAETGEAIIQALAFVFAGGKDGSDDSRHYWAMSIRKRKSEFRRELKAMGDLMTALKPTALIDECANRAKIVVGVRRLSEAQGYLQRCGWNDSIWIRMERNDSLKVGFELSDWPVHFRIGNERTLSVLQEKLRIIAGHIQNQ